jgi:glutamate carboxypeptidase
LPAERIPQLLTAAILDPPEQFVRGEAERDGCEETECRRLLFPIIISRVIHIGKTGSDCIENFECTNERAAREDLDVNAAIARGAGWPAHAGGNPDKGRNAIIAMVEVVLAIESLNDPARGITTNVGLINGGTARNTVAEDCTIEVDLRFCDRASASEMEAKILALESSRPDIETRVTGKITRPPFARDRRVDLIFERATAIARTIGFALESAPLVGGGSDGNFTVEMGIPTLDGLGVDGDGAHTNHEHLLFSSIEPRTRLLQGLMELLE